MKKIINLFVIAVIACAVLLSTIVFTNRNALANSSAAKTNEGTFNDNFDDDTIGDAWNQSTSSISHVDEANGVLNMEIAAGQDGNGNNQSVNVDTKEAILKGDFDVQVDFNLGSSSPLYGANAILSVDVDRDVSGKVREGVGIGISSEIKDGSMYLGYVSAQNWHNSTGGGNYDGKSSTTSDQSGKFRIKRVGNKISTYYWDNSNQSWVKHYSATLGTLPDGVGVKAVDNLEIRLGTWNSPLDYSSFWVKWDNLISRYTKK